MMFFFIIIAIIIIIIFAVNSSNESKSKESQTKTDRKTIEYNLRDYPNEYEFFVSGVHLPDYSYAVFNICKENDLVLLVSEPNNKFDSDAIKVEVSNWHIGYVPAGETYEVHEIIKKDYLAYINSRNIVGYVSVSVKIRYKD